MSEYSGFIGRNKPQMNADERRCGLDICGSLGKGMLAKENIETSGLTSGLTPLGFGVDVRNRIMNIGRVSDGFSTTECTENTEILKNSSGLSPLRPFGEIHCINKKGVSLGECFSATEGLETLRNSSGLTPLDFDIKPQINADERRCCCIGIENNEEAEPELNFSCRSVPLGFCGEVQKRGVI